MLDKTLHKAILLIDKTLRKKYLNDTERFPSQAIYPFWHNNEFAMLMNNQNQNIVIMVSLSKDGELLSSLLHSFGYLTVRGSSTRGGERALIEMIRLGRKGHDLAFAADGPLGPYHKLKSGVLYAAQKLSLPIICIVSASKWRLVLKKTWDKERVPLPFSKVIQIWDGPIYINKDDNIDEKTVEVEERLNKLFDFADKYYWQKDIAKYLRYHPAPKILIVQPSRIGDIVFTLPSLVSIKKKYPHSRIFWLSDERCAPLLENNPYLEKTFIWDRSIRKTSYFKNLKKELRSQKFDLSIDFYGLAKSAFFVNLAGAKFKIASSSTNGMRELSYLFSKQIKNPNLDAHCIDRHLSAANFIGAPSVYEYPIVISDEDLENVKKKLKKEGTNLENIIGIHPGGGWLSRRWGAVKYAELIKKLKQELNACIVLIGGKEGGSGEQGLDGEIIALSGVSTINLTGKLSLKELCAFFKLCRLFIGNEAGPMHIATALKTPSIALLGPTNAKRTGPYEDSDTLILQKQVRCQPCRNRNCKEPICMMKISVDEVFEEAKKTFLS